jgi:glycerophosphoryl diester phosphodiesterase
MRMRPTFGAIWQQHRPLVLGHRGASKHAPENTLAAFRLAREVGADGIELDVHLSADEVPVVIHNSRVDATTDGSGPVGALTLREIKALDAGAHFDAAYAGERIPMLAEVFEEVGDDLIINIELKPQPQARQGLEAAVIDVIQSMGMADRVWFSSFKPYSLAVARRAAPHIPCGLLLSPMTLTALWLLPFTPMEAFHLHHTLLPRWMAGLLRRLHLKSVVWTVDAPITVQKMVDAQVDAVITNDPAAVLRQLGRG